MRTVKWFLIGGLLAVIAGGCSKQERGPSADGKSDQQLIQEALTEAIIRWHYGDKGALYDNEFEYLRERISFDDYLALRELGLDADTVEGINAKKIELFGRDSAKIDAEIVFKGPTGKVSRAYDTYWMWYFRGRWIRPTVSRLEYQVEFDQSRRAADSAADAEAKELGDK